MLFEFSRNKKSIVELGTARGLSTLVLASHGSPVTTIDNYKVLDLGVKIFKLDSRGSKSTFKKIKDYLTLGRNIECIKSDSVKASKEFESNSIDLLFIDAGHEYEQVKKDFEAWLPKVMAGGFILFHDYSNAHLGVKQYIDEEVIPNYCERKLLEEVYYKTMCPIVIKIFKKLEDE